MDEKGWVIPRHCRMQSSAAGDAGPFLWEGVRCLVVFEVFGSGIFFVAIFLVVGGGGVYGMGA